LSWHYSTKQGVIGQAFIDKTRYHLIGFLDMNRTRPSQRAMETGALNTSDWCEVAAFVGQLDLVMNFSTCVTRDVWSSIIIISSKLLNITIIIIIIVIFNSLLLIKLGSMKYYKV
jgi:hypothetical protein